MPKTRNALSLQCAAIARCLKHLLSKADKPHERGGPTVHFDPTNTAMALCLAVFCCLVWQRQAHAAALLMAIPGEMNLLPSAAPGDMQLSANSFAQTPDVNASGAFSYSIPIQVPPGTHGMMPHLALTYSSAGGDGYVGLGWSISGLSAITRCAQTVAQDGHAGGVNYDTNDRFCLDGQRLLRVTGSAYGASPSTYQTEVSNFASITASGQVSTDQPQYFTVVMKNGMQYEYGNTAVEASSQISADGSNGTIVRVWALDKVTDTSGNYMTFTYTILSNGEDYVPARIDYTGNAGASTATYSSVRFGYYSTDRADAVTGYQAGYPIRPQKLLQYITTYTGSTGHLQYSLTYNNANPGYSHNQLAQLTVCDLQSPNACLATMNFGWQPVAGSWQMNKTANTLVGGYTLAPGDFNGDGLTDALAYKMNNANCPSKGQIYLGEGNGTTYYGNGDNGGTVHTSADYSYAGENQYNLYQWSQYDGSPACFQDALEPPWVADYNGDGISDVMVSAAWAQNEGSYYQWYYETQSLGSDGKGDFTQANQNNTIGNPGTENLAIDLGANYFVSGDMTGDGRTDYFAMSEDDDPNHNTTWANFWTGDGAGNFAAGNNIGFDGGSQSAFGGDFDGNGCTDVLEESTNQNETPQVLLTCTRPGDNTSFAGPQIASARRIRIVRTAGFSTNSWLPTLTATARPMCSTYRATARSLRCIFRRGRLL
ncbi:MAG TPA: SpvB/TcaC N-terminal domain-containing protein [Rhizomicrobium sp.]|jgi:hypothetical protein|nr:SpvB/TcaC N-terminal domain-containing protein [Rhizomicrobium sp.]